MPRRASFAAPRVLQAETDPTPLDRPFLVMRRLPGDNMVANASEPGHRVARITRAPGVLAAAQALLHGMPGEVLCVSALRYGIDPAVVTLEGEIRNLGASIARDGLFGLSEGVAGWSVTGHRRPKRR